MRLIPKRLKRGMVMGAVLWFTKGMAVGDFGVVPQKIWLFMEGSKTYTGLAFILAGFAFGEAFNRGICDACPDWNQALLGIGAVLAQLGLIDAANREDGPDDGPKVRK